MWGERVFLIFLGVSSGGMVAAGVFAFLTAIGLFPRLIAKTRTRRYIRLYETFLILGGMGGNVLTLYPISLWNLGSFWLVVIGVFIGVFVGCLVMSLAETLQAIPVLARRIHLAVGIQWIIVSFAIGKMAGALYYFAEGWGLE